MLRFALFSTPDEGPPLFKDHICVTHRVVSQEGDYSILLLVFLEDNREHLEDSDLDSDGDNWLEVGPRWIVRVGARVGTKQMLLIQIFHTVGLVLIAY